MHRTPRTWVREAVFKAEHGVRVGIPEGAPRVARVLTGTRVLESALLGRHKFYHPRPWIRDYLREFIEDKIREVARDGLSGFVEEPTIKTTLENHFTHGYNRTLELERLLCVALAREGMFQVRIADPLQRVEVCR